uniref:Twinfilin n=1 Tax=Photinus pyralis TaxID=7054 RepID=A0A1Y1MDH8_PHOPY
MSHQTGIKANNELKEFFGRCRDGSIRALKISICDEQLALATSVKDKRSYTWDKCFDQVVVPLVEENQPCYILYRLDTKSDLGYEWLFISWSPDTAPVREKMLYASTKATLKQEFGNAQIKEEIRGSIMSEVTLDGYYKFKKAAVAPAPLSSREEEIQEMKRNEVHTDYSITSKQQTLGGVTFPITSEAEAAILDMARNSYNYLQFRIDVEEEKIHLVTSENVNVDKLASKLPKDSPRYLLYNFKHTHEGDYMESIVFIYYMPGYSCSIKERMLYSSCSNPFTATIGSLGVEIAKKIEIDTDSELTEKNLYEEVHPTKNLHRPIFAKPKGPPGRGPKRMIKSQNS